MSPSEIKQLRILVCHLEPLLVLGLAAALRQQARFEVLTLDRDVRTSPDPSADIVVTNHQVGLALAADVRRRPRVVVMTERDRRQDVRAALDAGVRGYMVFGFKVEDLAECIDVVAGGACYVSPAASRNEVQNRPCETPVMSKTAGLDIPAGMSLVRGLRIAAGAMKTRVEVAMGRLELVGRNHGAGILSQVGRFDESSPLSELGRRQGATPPASSYT